MSRVRAATLTAMAVGAQAGILVVVALRRPIDPDEGWYGFAAVRAIHGDVPYVDFFFPQMPLLPYVFGTWTVAFGESWYAERLCAAVLAIAAGTIVFLRGKSLAGAWAAVAGTIVYAASSLVFVWFTTIKTYALTACLLVAALVVLEHRTTRRLAFGGVLFGLAVSSRLLAAAALPAFAYAAWRGGRRGIAIFGAGSAVGLAPAFALLAWNPDEFVFDNLGYHSLRSSHGLIGNLAQKRGVVENLVGLGSVDHVAGLQFLALLVVAGAAAVVAFRRTRRVPLALVVAALVGLASLLPTPSFVQYFSVTVPFLVLGVLEVLPLLPRRSELLVAGVAATLVYVAAAGPDVHKYAVEKAAPGTDIPAVRRVAAAVRARSPKRALASWPGYLIGTDASPVDGTGLANFVLDAVDRMDAGDVRSHRLLTRAQVEALIRSRRVPLIVYRPWAASTGPRWTAVIRSSGYRTADLVSTARIFELPG